LRFAARGGLALASYTAQLLPAASPVVVLAAVPSMSRKQVIVKQLLAIENLVSMTRVVFREDT